MKGSNKDPKYILKIVGELPLDYTKERNLILENIQMLRAGNDLQTLTQWLHNYINALPTKHGWTRKHIYLLVRELLHNDQTDDILDDILYDIESGIVRDCALQCIRSYPGEPESNSEELEAFVRDYKWLP